MSSADEEKEKLQKEINARRDRDLAIMKAAAVRLSEHFSSVQIFCTKDPVQQGQDDQGTESYQTGEGNWFARYGQVHAWVQDQIRGYDPHAVKRDNDESL